MAWYKREEPDDEEQGEKRSVPAGVFSKCPGCRETLQTAELKKNLDVCPRCDHHYLLPTRERVAITLDEGSVEELDARVESSDPLGFHDSKKYPDRLRAAKRQAGISEALVAVKGTIENIPVEAGFFAFEFMGGSMGSVVGEKVTRVFERALGRRVPALIFCSSGGARMQEGLLSLMQMAKTSAAVARLRAAAVPLISVLLHPTTGGVAASFAMLGDFIVAEPKALIGFAGARVIQNTIRQSLPPGFQRAEFLLAHGFVDCIAHRKDLKATLGRMLRFLTASPVPAAAQ
jgi:acetyl-CoA carboxylase carboxyl transferase subunit beta